MKNKLASLLAMLALVLIISSCGSDTPATPVESTDVFPNMVGNYWINENYSLDTLGVVDTKSLTIDSTIVTGSVLMNGKQATEMTSYTIGSKDTASKAYIAKEGNTVFMDAMSINELASAFSGFVEVDATKLYLDEKWLLIVDPSKTSWTSATKNFTNIPFKYSTFAGTMSGTNIVTGRKGGTESITLQGKTSTAQEYIMESNIVSNLSIIIPAGTVKVKFVNHIWIVNGIGMVKQSTENIIIDMDVSLAGIKQIQKIPGGKATCIRYKIK